MSKMWPMAAGEMAQRIRARPWPGTPGATSAWPRALRCAVDLMLDSGQPGFVAWGESLLTLYNDAAAALLGARHPDALGMPFPQLFSQAWHELQPLASAALRGEAQFFEDRAMPMPGRDSTPARWFSCS